MNAKKTTRQPDRVIKAAEAQRIIIEDVYPEIDGGRFPIKRVVGEMVDVKAFIYSDGHDEVRGAIRYRSKSDKNWREAPMLKGVNDQWAGSFRVEKQEDYVYSVLGWVDEFATWRIKLSKLWEAQQDVSLELKIGALIFSKAAKKCKGKDNKLLANLAKEAGGNNNTFYVSNAAASQDILDVMNVYGERNCLTGYPKELKIKVDRPKALFSAWYELFPRSWNPKPGAHGTLKGCETLLPEIARMGFDVLYLPPIHPIGTTHRKGKNNSTVCEKDSPGCPWAIGSAKGGHKSIHPRLGTLADFRGFITKAKSHNLEVAMDIAFQCSPDHPYVKKHPEWFKWRPDGTIQYAENPPKKYEDVYPINFETDDWQNLWSELKSVFLFWIKQGVRIFRVDNPHTKPFLFWDWVIEEIRTPHPDVIFLAEAFTRPKIMQRLAKGGFQQSYTYFTWRVSGWDFSQYMNELVQTEMREYFRPNFWPNTPDILPYHLQNSGRPAFIMRLVLAATLSSNYGIYGPAFELCVSEPVANKEEYLNSEKYEIKQWNWDAAWNLKDFISRVNYIRRTNPALQTTWNLKFVPLSNENMLCYYKMTEDQSNIILIVVNLDPHHTQSGWVHVPLQEWGIGGENHYVVRDLICNVEYAWQGEHNYVELNPHSCPAHIFKVIKG